MCGEGEYRLHSIVTACAITAVLMSCCWDSPGVHSEMEGDTKGESFDGESHLQRPLCLSRKQEEPKSPRLGVST